MGFLLGLPDYSIVLFGECVSSGVDSEYSQSDYDRPVSPDLVST
jgi:hypothetical protein